MLKSLGLDWIVEEDKIDGGQNTKEIQSQNHIRKSEKNRKREIKEGEGRKIIGDKTKVKDDIATSAATDDNGDYEVRGNLGDDSLAEESKRTNVKEEGFFSPELGSKEVKVEVFESESGRKNLKEQLFSSLLNLKESVAELKEGISVAKEVKGKKGKKVKEMREKEREMDYGLWQPFYNEDVRDEEVVPPSPVTMHLLPAPDLAKQTNKEQDEKSEVQENQPSLKSQGNLTSSHPRRRNYQKERQAVRRRTRKRTTSRMLTPWKRFSPKTLLRKAKMMLRSVQS